MIMDGVLLDFNGPGQEPVVQVVTQLIIDMRIVELYDLAYPMRNPSHPRLLSSAGRRLYKDHHGPG